MAIVLYASSSDVHMNNSLHHSNELFTAVRISRIQTHAETVKTFYCTYSLRIKPGQFLMLWLPRVDEKPFTVSCLTPTEFGVTVQAKGAFTQALFKLKKGDYVGIRGPYGNGYILSPKNLKNACVVGGGVGMAELTLLIEHLKNPTIIYGARTRSLLAFKGRFKGMFIATDDGSSGIKGTVIDILEHELKSQKFSVVYTCGPELMMYRVFKLCEEYGVACQASLERYMSCGFGVCGKCVINDKLCCMDGPVFSSTALRALTEFGTMTKDKAGRKIVLQ